MTGGTLPHNDVAVNLTAVLKNHLRSKGCKVRMADAKVGISPQGPFHYPDVVLSCDPRDYNTRQVMYYPCLIVEVFSPSTEAFDRGDKFKHYRCLDTLREYVLISPNSISVECYQLNDKGKWELTPYVVEETTQPLTELTVSFPSIDFHCPLSIIYEDVVF